MGFSEVLGHEAVKQILKGAYLAGRVHHAYLFVGPEGVGKELLAFQLIKLLNCHEPRGGGMGDAAALDCCDTCTACRKINDDAESFRDGDPKDGGSSRFSDLMALAPVGRFIKIEAVREVIKRLPYSPVEGRTKCVLMRDADNLHPAAANSLLKTLEEPPTETLFVLVSSNPHVMLPTILSRCQPVRFGGLKPADITRYLVERADLSPVAARPIAAMATGSIGRAVELLNHPVVLKRVTWLREMNALCSAPDHERLAMAESLAADKQHVPVYLDLLRSWLRDQLLVIEGLNDESLTNVDLAAEARVAAGATDRFALMDKLARVETAERGLLGNSNLQLTLDWLLLRL